MTTINIVSHALMFTALAESLSETQLPSQATQIHLKDVIKVRDQLFEMMKDVHESRKYPVALFDPTSAKVPHR